MEKKEKDKKKKEDRKKVNWKNLGRALRTLAKDSPVLLPLTFLASVLNAAYPYIGILLSAEILTGLTDPARDMRRLFFLAILLVALNFLGRGILNFAWQMVDVLQYVEMKKIDKSITVKAWKMDYVMYEDPKIAEQKRMMTRWHYSRGVLALVEQLRGFVNATATIVISLVLVIEFFSAKAVGEGKMAGFLNHWTASVLFLALFGLSTAYGIWCSAKIQQRSYQLDQDNGTPMNQFTDLMSDCCARYEKGKDIRMFGAADKLFQRLREPSDMVVRNEEKCYKHMRKMTISSVLLNRLFNLLVYLFVGLKAIYGAFGVGSILKYTGMVVQFGGGVSGLFDSVRSFLQNLHYIDDYFVYQDRPNRTADGQLPITEEIRKDYVFEFKDVTFTYSGAQAPSLSKVNCCLRKGRKVAIVGRNGSGKSTFIKLLCRLYDPQEGEILLNGVDIRKYRYEEYLEFFSTVFQDYEIFAFQLGENVAAESEYEREKAVKALEDAGFGERLNTLEKGLDTQLFKYFSEDGVELSGGESQKVAIARCLYKNAPYVVMDEPTAALDPVAEADIYQRMNEFTLEKGAVYISHRLSSCYFCDYILVFEEGGIVEQGTHEALLGRRGLYRKLWDAQSKYYA